VSGGHSLPGTTLRERTSRAVADPVLRGRTRRAVDRFGLGRLMALDAVEDAEGLRRAARAVRAEVLADLPAVLDRLADRLLDAGAHVHWSPDAADANAYVAAVAAERGARTVVKSKSMATEETGLNGALEAAGCRVVETDLGEWIVQLARETPSHLIAPALHHDRHSVAELFERTTGATGVPPVPEALNAWARARLREEFLRADLGVTGVNFAVADTGSIVLVTNEGNGRMVTTLPPVHVAVLGMERVVATWDQLDLLLGLLTRSASGQWLTSYTTVLTGPRRPGEADGPEELHVVILDNGRSEVLGGEYHEMLACIRCGACLNTCPVYRQVGGHSYGWVYSGPMGAVLTPLLARQYEEAAEVADASTLCGACMDACPVGIPLQDLLLRLRRRNAAGAPWSRRAGWRAWSAAWSSPAGYRATTRAATAAGRVLGREGRAARLATAAARRLPVAGGWAHGRSLPAPAARRFRDRWAAGDV
jgi:L-lactate dehydrogenase complex protein LldF